jgi:hypothetical protein
MKKIIKRKKHPVLKFGNQKICQKCKRVNESTHHKYCQDCWEKEKMNHFITDLTEYSKRKEVNENKALQKIINSFMEILNPMVEKFKVIEKTNRKIKREKVWEHKMESGDYMRVFLLNKPRLNDVDDIEVEMNGVYGTTAFGIQDWEAMALISGLNQAILKKYNSYENAVESLIKTGKIIAHKTENINK